MPGLVPGIHVLACFKNKAWMAGTSPAMTAGQAFISGIVTGSCARSSREQLVRSAKTLLPGDRVELLQPLFHRLAKIVATLAERGVALLDEVALLPGQRQRRAMAVGFRTRDHPQEHVVDVAVELGEAGIGADRLFDLAFAVAQLKLGRFFW